MPTQLEMGKKEKTLTSFKKNHLTFIREMALECSKNT